MAKYRVRTSCEVLNQWRMPADVFELTDEQARPLLPPHGDVIVKVPEIMPVPASKKERGNGRFERS